MPGCWSLIRRLFVIRRRRRCRRAQIRSPSQGSQRSLSLIPALSSPIEPTSSLSTPYIFHPSASGSNELVPGRESQSTASVIHPIELAISQSPQAIDHIHISTNSTMTFSSTYFIPIDWPLWTNIGTVVISWFVGRANVGGMRRSKFAAVGGISYCSTQKCWIFIFPAPTACP
jgi:hypothetical protein